MIIDWFHHSFLRLTIFIGVPTKKPLLSIDFGDHSIHPRVYLVQTNNKLLIDHDDESKDLLIFS